MQSRKKSKATKKRTSLGIVKVKKKGAITEFRLPNGLKVLYVYREGTGVITSNILYRVGARDEIPGETGVAHMLEHMLFKRTTHDIARKSTPESMNFEREVGCVLNANTWKDRTTYYYSYPKEHFDRALKIEAERMREVVLTEEFLQERANVLSEFDMHAGNEEFALSVQMVGVAMQSHPYGHETIGYREDIEAYTPEVLDAFYRKYYAPNNATLIIVGDVSEHDMCLSVAKYFGRLLPSAEPVIRKTITEPKQEGLRTIEIRRPSSTNVLALGVLHEGFPSIAWFEAHITLSILAGSEDSILHKILVDTGLATALHAGIEPTYDKNLGIMSITLAPSVQHADVYARIRETIDTLTVRTIAPHLKKVIAQALASEFVQRENSLGIVAELVEYESAGAWEHFDETENILRKISPRDILTRIQQLFDENALTLGRFVGRKK